jgi:hypothetical protein
MLPRWGAAVPDRLFEPASPIETAIAIPMPIPTLLCFSSHFWRRELVNIRVFVGVLF